MTFDIINAICFEQDGDFLPDMSLNGIVGSWSPEFNNSATTTYYFSPESLGCFVPFSWEIGVYPEISLNLEIQEGIIVTDNEFEYYQWYFNGVLLPGAGMNTYLPSENGLYELIVVDSNGCYGSSSIVYSQVGITQSLGQGNIVFPNPASDAILFKLSDVKMNITIYDAAGKKIISFMPDSENFYLDIQFLSSGLYHVIFQNEAILENQIICVSR